MGFGLSKYIETGTAGQHQSGGPCCGDYCPLWEVGGGEVGLGGEEEENIETDTEQQSKESVMECKKSWWSGHNNTLDNIILRKQ